MNIISIIVSLIVSSHRIPGNDCHSSCVYICQFPLQHKERRWFERLVNNNNNAKISGQMKTMEQLNEA